MFETRNLFHVLIWIFVIGTAALNRSSRSFRMKAWQVHNYGEDLVLSDVRIPVVENPKDYLIKVEAVSVNPLDYNMRDGYLRAVLNLMRHYKMELPLTLGRDFSGTIVSKGMKTSDDYKIGDKVYGFIPVPKQGCFAEYVIAEEGHIRHQPENLRPVESASIVYVAMTAWSALFLNGGFKGQNIKDRRVLVLGASGGVGTVAVQILKSQGAHVTGTCSTNAVPLVRSLGADEVFDYKEAGYLDKIGENSYDTILDCAKFGSNNLPPTWRFRQYITLDPPIGNDTGKYGLVFGLLKSGSDFLFNNFQEVFSGKAVKWGLFTPSAEGFKFIDDIVKKNEIKPLIHKEFDFNHLPDAIKEVEKGHLRGKVVVSLV